MAVEFNALYDENGLPQTGGNVSWAWWNGLPLTAPAESGTGLVIGDGGTLVVPVVSTGSGYLELKDSNNRGLYPVVSR